MYLTALFRKIVYGLFNNCFQISFLSQVKYPVLPQQNEGRKASHTIETINASNDFIVENKSLLNMPQTKIYNNFKHIHI